MKYHTPPLTKQRSTERAGVSSTVLGHAPLLKPEKSKQELRGGGVGVYVGNKTRKTGERRGATQRCAPA